MPHDLWQPLADWVAGISWTGLQPTAGIKSQAHRKNVTWLELTVALQYDTGYTIAGTAAILDEQASCFRAAFSKLLNKAEIKNGKRKTTSRTAFEPRAKNITTAHLTGVQIPGLQRRPKWNNEMSSLIANIVLEDHDRACATAGAATTAWLNDYKVRYPSTRTKWTPGPIAQLHQFMHEQHSNKDNKATKVPAAAKGAQKIPLAGLCLFGHQFTTLRNNGKPQWLPNPHPPLWEGTKIGAALCQKCYIQGRTAAARRRREQPTYTATDNKNYELPSSAKRRRCLTREAAGETMRELKATPLYPPEEPCLPPRFHPLCAGRSQPAIATARPPRAAATSSSTSPPEK